MTFCLYNRAGKILEIGQSVNFDGFWSPDRELGVLTREHNVGDYATFDSQGTEIEPGAEEHGRQPDADRWGQDGLAGCSMQSEESGRAAE